MKPTLSILLAGIIAVLPVSLGAQELGRIDGTLDGAARSWHTIQRTRMGRTVATASLVQGPRLTELNIQGHPEPRFSTDDVLSLEVRYLGAYFTGADPVSVDILHMPKGMGGPFWTTKGAPRPPSVEIVSLDVWGNFGRLHAAFAGLICQRKIISAATDPDDCKEVTGVVETDLQVE